jgi:quinol-cytochrome oxidoreductase complex cytochrome b subunit
MFERDSRRERLPFLNDIRTREGREKWMQQARDALFRMADRTTRAVSAGMGIADVRALFRGEPPVEDPNARDQVLTNAFFAHIRPRYYAKSATKFAHTFAFGFLSVFALIVEGLTGMLLAVFYIPTVDQAYQSTAKIIAEVPFGAFVRNLHAAGATLLVIVVAAHLLRVYLTGSFKQPRQFTWVTGVILLLITLGSAYTGSLLTWDQSAYWGVSLGTSVVKSAPLGDIVSLLVRGGETIGQNGLSRFYLAHVILLPLAAIVLLSVHYYRIARVHGISLPASEEESPDPAVRAAAQEHVDYLPEILTKELMWISIAICVILFIAVFALDATLGRRADPFHTPTHATTPWYFLWLQGALKDPFVLPFLRWLKSTLSIDLVHFYNSSFWQGIVLPTVMLLVLLSVPYIDEFWMHMRGATSSRLAQNRKLGISLGLLVIGLLFVFSYFGTPFFAATTSPAAEIADQYMPEECVRAFVPLFPDDCGAVRRLGYANLQVGMHDLAEYATVPASANPFPSLLARMQASVQQQRARGLANAKGTLAIEEWQTNLKKITLRLNWTPPQRDGDAGSFERTIYLHRDSTY